jgi:glycosyltransferase involved in cell wall biosynthesis
VSAGASPYSEPYVFFVGALAPHKNVPGLIDAFDALDVPHELVIAGPRAWGAAAVDAAIASARKKDIIRCVGYISEEEKVRRLQHADAFVFPSIAEGFGVPVLEAMACGAPVITTTGSAPEEFATGAAQLVEPNDVDALRDALGRVLTDARLARSLSEQGSLRAKDFGWEVAARRTVDVWRKAAS